MLGVSLIIIAAAIVYMVETYISTYYTIEYMHGTSLFLILLAKYGTPVLFLLLCAYIAYRNFLKKQKAAASAVSITSNKITSLTKDLSKRAIICRIGAKIDNERGAKNSKRVNESMSELTTAFYGEYVRRMLVCIDEMTTEMRENANGKEYFPDIFHASSSVIADIFEACGIDLPDYVRILYYNYYMGDESIGCAAIEKIELAWQADPSKFRVDKKQNRLIYSYPPDGPWYELKYIADELPNSLEAEISGGNQLIMNYEQAQELFGIKFRRWLGIFNL